MSAADLVARLDDLAKSFGHRIEVLRTVRQAAWDKFPTVTYTWSLVALQSPRPRSDADFVGPIFRCSHTSLPCSTKSQKFRELKTWASDVAKYLRTHHD